MSDVARYALGPARGAEIIKQEGESWTLVLVRTLRHSPERVWRALTDPAELREWAPFDADHDLSTAGASVRLTTVGAPSPHVTETTITRADAPKLLEYTWGGRDMRWELEAVGAGTRLTLWASIDRRYIALGVAGRHVCLDVLDHLLSETPIGRIVGPAAMKVEGWQQLYGEYSRQFGVEPPSWSRGEA